MAREDEERWGSAFADPRSHALLERLADQAIEDERAGRTEHLETWLDEEEESGTDV